MKTMMSDKIGNYAEVNVNGKRRLIEIHSEKNGIVKGYRVLKDGSRWDKDDGKVWAQELIVVPAANVICKMQLDIIFGELVKAEAAA
jgi:hypothetical protein